MDVINALDLAGTFVFAVSGALTAGEKKFDIFGAATIALATAVGGGTLRDLLIGARPVGWMTNHNYLLLILLAVPAAWLFRKYFLRLRRTMFLFDTIGIGLFTILGVEKTLMAGLSPLVAVMMGTVSAVFGGVLRDILCNEVPLIFRKEIYATACIAGAVLFLILGWAGVGYDADVVLTVLLIIAIRILAVTKKWRLPVIN